MSATRKRLAWEREYDEAVQWRDWQTCDLLFEAQPPDTRLARLWRELTGREFYGWRDTHSLQQFWYAVRYWRQRRASRRRAQEDGE